MAFRESKWTRVLESRPVPLMDQLKEEMARELARKLGAEFPPEISEFESDRDQAEWALLWEPPITRPPDAIYRHAFLLADWELGREYEAIDDFMRNARWRDADHGERERKAMLFLSRWMEEQLLSLIEATDGRVKRAALREVLARTESLLLGAGWGATPGLQ